jgi:hypothetical protein
MLIGVPNVAVRQVAFKPETLDDRSALPKRARREAIDPVIRFRENA